MRLAMRIRWGRHVDWPEENRSFEIVGVVRDTKTSDYFAEPPPTVYFSYPQHQNSTTATLLVSVEGEPSQAVPRLHQWLRNHESYLAIIHIVPYRDVVSGYLYTHRMNAEMFSVVAGLGLALSVVGIFSVVSLAVGRRRREIAVRMAVGAERSDISRLVISRALVSVGLGLAMGLAMSYLLSGLVSQPALRYRAHRSAHSDHRVGRARRVGRRCGVPAGTSGGNGRSYGVLAGGVTPARCRIAGSSLASAVQPAAGDRSVSAGSEPPTARRYARGLKQRTPRGAPAKRIGLPSWEGSNFAPHLYL